jgi:hypothetical protein
MVTLLDASHSFPLECYPVPYKTTSGVTILLITVLAYRQKHSVLDHDTLYMRGETFDKEALHKYYCLGATIAFTWVFLPALTTNSSLVPLLSIMSKVSA